MSKPFHCVYNLCFRTFWLGNLIFEKFFVNQHVTFESVKEKDKECILVHLEATKIYFLC